MRRYRFGRIAALIAAAYAVAAVAAGVLALVTGDPTLLRLMVTKDAYPQLMPFTWWLELLLVAGGLLQGWAYWQVLRGRRAGEPAEHGRQVGLLRAALYLSVADSLLYLLPVPYQWWFGLPGSLIQFAIVWLFFVVLTGVLPRWLRLLGLLAGLSSIVLAVISTVAYGFGPFPLLEFLWHLPLGLIYLLWLVLVLIGQARDPRWSRATVRMGVIAVTLSFPSSLSSGSSSFISIGGTVDVELVLYMLMGVLGVFGMVWVARSAHDLGGPLPAPSPAPSATRAARRPWSLAGVAVLLPLIPAAVNLAHGMPVWIGPRGMVDAFFHEYASDPATLLWLAVDVLVGVGAPALLILAAVVRRTRRLLRGTMWALTVAAAAGVLSALTARPDPDRADIPRMAEPRLTFYPEGLFAQDENGQLLFGLSPLWYSAALVASALVLFFLYGPAPSARARHHVLVTALAAFVALCFLPAADQSRGPVTTAEDCSPPDHPRLDLEAEPVPVTGPRAFICAVRANRTPEFADTTPDQVLLAYGRRMCGVYSRNDPRELARVLKVEGVDPRSLNYVLSAICPAADASVKAANAEREREYAEFDAEEQRKCDATPRHRPLIKPAKALRLKEPEWPEVGLSLYDEPTENGDRTGESGPVSWGSGQLNVRTHSDYHVCVTLETYTRRPPVETKGWEHVVEVGWDSPSGEMTFEDSLSGTALPDLSLNGRKGHYRIRVHFAWFPWKGDEYGTQRLLIMAYPGSGDKVTTYRKPAQRR